MEGISTIVVSGRQIVLLGVAGLLSISGAIAIGILLFGDFGETEGRVLFLSWRWRGPPLQCPRSGRAAPRTRLGMLSAR